MLRADSPALVLAPMEGVTDAPMRALQGACGAFTYAVSEFLRVSQAAPPRAVFLRHVPELNCEAHTPTGLPVQVQLLGGDAAKLAEAALIAVNAGATAIDLNFGCPAKTVNKHDGGATLLQYPPRIREIVRTVRDALPRSIPVSAKLRLGWDDASAIHENAAMAAEGGADWITIHARTRMQGYQPPVVWPLVGRVREALPIPIIANGDIWSLADFRRCREETGCIHFMLGRGALASPNLARQVAAEMGLIAKENLPPVNWLELMRSLETWANQYGEAGSIRTLHRMKQWLRLAAVHGEFDRFDLVKRCGSVSELLMIFSPPFAAGTVDPSNSPP